MDRLEKLEALIKHFNGAIKSLSLYPATHPASARFFTKIQESLEELFQEKEEVTIGVVEEALVLEDMPLKAAQEVFLGFASRLKEREVGSVAFLKGVTLEEVRAFVEALRTEAGALKAQGGMGQVLAQRGVHHIRLATPLAPEAPEEPIEEDFERIQARIIHERALGVARETFEAARLGKIPSLPQVKRTVEALMDGIFKNKYAYLALTMIKSYDEYLFTHSVNVGILAIALGESLGLDKETLRELGLGAMLHDLGKVKWPDSVHKKPRDLSEDEWRIVKRHPLDGVRMVEKMGEVSPASTAAIREHHLRHDRTGYPDLEEGKEPGFLSAIVTVVDAYDAMTTVRPYQNAFEPFKAIERMRSLSGKVFDPEILEGFIKLMGIYPVGSLVRLSTGELALVVKIGQDPARPQVKLLFDRAGRRVDGEVDLSELDEAGTFKRSILTAVDPATKGIDVTQFL